MLLTTKLGQSLIKFRWFIFLWVFGFWTWNWKYYNKGSSFEIDGFFILFWKCGILGYNIWAYSDVLLLDKGVNHNHGYQFAGVWGGGGGTDIIPDD